MRDIAPEDLRRRLSFENPWWRPSGEVTRRARDNPRRAHFEAFVQRALQPGHGRPLVLTGPRRAGKSIMIEQAIQAMREQGVPGRAICRVGLDNPAYGGVALPRFVEWFVESWGELKPALAYVIFDAIQYAADWRAQLTGLAEAHPSIRFIGVASAIEPDAPHPNSDFLLPPLAFSEYLRFLRGEAADDEGMLALRIGRDFRDYVNYGCLPEHVTTYKFGGGYGAREAADTLAAALLRDLPGPFAVQDPQEFNRLFALLAYNVGGELSLIDLVRSTGISKNTVVRYLDYMEAGHLIVRLSRLDERADRFLRETHFKAYLVNPALRAALFGPVGADDPLMARLAENALVLQYLHTGDVSNLFYARWPGGEVDFVILDRKTEDPWGALLVQWTPPDTANGDPFAGLSEFTRRQPRLKHVRVLADQPYPISPGPDRDFTCEAIADYCRRVGAAAIESSLNRRPLGELSRAPSSPDADATRSIG
jgi:predicted AAA+ superfamily ATPase